MFQAKTKEAIKILEKITAKGYSHYDVFRDWVDLMLYALSGEEAEYMRTIGRYRNEGEIGKREADYFAQAFGELVNSMKETNAETLGSIYEEWNIQNKCKGQFFTPGHIAEMMSKMMITGKENVLDPACGAGIMLVSAAKAMSWEDGRESFFTGQDLDERCVKMCALNLCFFNLNGFAIQGNSLTMECNWGYRTIRSPFGGSVRPMTGEELESMKPSIFKAVRQQAALF